jgi:hypothetical protein
MREKNERRGNAKERATFTYKIGRTVCKKRQKRKRRKLSGGERHMKSVGCRRGRAANQDPSSNQSELQRDA